MTIEGVKNLKYKLIISDFDGTFRHRDTSIGKKTIDAVREYVRRGGKFAICTGRMPVSIQPILKKLELEGVYVAYQASVVGEIQSGKFIYESGFTKEQALRICAVMLDMGLRIHVYDRDNCYVNYEDDYLRTYEEICAIKAVRVDDDIYSFIQRSENKFFKLLAMVTKEDRNVVCDKLKVELGEDEFFISYSASTLVEITSVCDTKAAAVGFLCDYYNIKAENVLAFGDNQNDAPLLSAAGHGVAVANADPSLKAIADEVFDKTCDEDAVGEYILRYVL